MEFLVPNPASVSAAPPHTPPACSVRSLGGQRGHSASMADALKAQGNTAFKEGRYQESIGYFTSAIDLDSGNHIQHRLS